MKILITGLALSRNLGAPAMALTMVSELRKKFQDVEVAFAVSSTDFDYEKKWADKYGIKLVSRDTITSYILNKYRIKYFYQLLTGKSKLEHYKNQKSRRWWLKVHDDYMQAFKENDIIIGMFGISYVGDGVEKFWDGLGDYSSIYYSNLHKKPYTRFIQSFGPFDSLNIRYFAKKEFEQLPFIPARGKNSAAYCRAITKNKDKVFDFPDIAILLPLADEDWLCSYLKQKNLQKKDYVVLSPSAVIYNMKKNVSGSLGDKHVDSFVLIAKYLIQQGEKILFLPHMYTDTKRDSDREVCYKIINHLSDEERKNVVIVEEEIDAMEAKALIANSKFSIVSRFHALVAAISSTTPVITLGWNIKYQDLMEYYNLEEMAIDVRKYTPEVVFDLVKNKMQYYENSENILFYKMLQDRVKMKVKRAFGLLYSWIEDVKQ